MDDLWTAIGLILFIEGALYTLFPRFMRRMLLATLGTPEAQMRVAGVCALCAGFALIWWVRSS